MEAKETLDYYSRRDIQQAILDSAKYREVGAMFGLGFGKRPDVVEYTGDIARLARQGATSFHVSEERWEDALSLKPGMSKKELDANRKGWDLLIDIDTPHWDYAKWTAYFVVEILKFYSIKSIGVKFSGNKGWHIGVPFEAFPDEVDGVNIKDHYPDGLRKIAAFLQDRIKTYLSAKILENETINEIANRVGKRPEELLTDDRFNPFTIIEIDTILISNRHMFRAPYSLHEKSGLVSLPIPQDSILLFEKETARPSNVKPRLKFFDATNVIKGEARSLLKAAFDWYTGENKSMVAGKNERPELIYTNFVSLSLGEKQKPNLRDKISVISSNEEINKIPVTAIMEECFPPCIKKILAGSMEDGKKRSLFILINFLRHMGWNWESIESRLREWNNSNPEQLSETYLLGQMNYAKNSRQSLLPPNCANANYYKDLGLCAPETLCSRIKNPVNYAKIRSKRFQENNPAKKKREPSIKASEKVPENNQDKA